MQTSLQNIFTSFSPKDPLTMDGREFAKCIKDCKLLTKKVTPTDVDLTFAKVKTPGAAHRRITYNQFCNAIDILANKEGVLPEIYRQKLISSEGPKYNATKAENVKFHDDKSLWTGVYAKGGPSNTSGKYNDLSALANRKVANVRGVNL